MKRVLLTLFALACVIAPTVPVQAQDLGEPDSLYFLSPTVELLNCFREVQVDLPLFLWSDREAGYFFGAVRWFGGGSCNSATMHSLTACQQCSGSFDSDSVSHECSVFLSCYCGVTPGDGAVSRFIFRAHLGDTLSISQGTRLFELYNMIEYWQPTYEDLDILVVLPDTLAAQTGDADCSGSVDISDAVFLITYIFAGGIPPYDMNAADENADCAVDISDVVYLIAYIFSSGPPPQTGCAVP